MRHRKVRVQLTPERIAEIGKLPMFNGVVYGDVTQAELDAYMAIPIPDDRMRQIFDQLRRDRDGQDDG
jgi:hypothetical protein